MHSLKKKIRRSALVFAALLAAGCTSLQPVDLPPEYTAAPADTRLWETLADERPGDWYALLNDGLGALDWRLRAIDSATESIDLQTFLWSVDTVGSLVLDHLVAAAERGVAVRLLVDDSFLLGKDDILLELGHQAGAEPGRIPPTRPSHAQQSDDRRQSRRDRWRPQPGR
jgi:putative cardiolipin synthase